MIEDSSSERLAQEPIIVEEGHYPDGLLMIRSGFARVSRRLNHGQQTVRYIGRGTVFGFDEIVRQWQSGSKDSEGYRYSLRSVGYTDVLRVPTSIIEEYVLPTMPEDILTAHLETELDTSVETNKIAQNCHANFN